MQTSFSIFQRLNAKFQAENVVLSCVSLERCLAMLEAGATEGSVTEKELRCFAESGLQSRHDGSLDLFNSLWSKGDLKGSFVDTVKAEHGADVFTLVGSDPTPINEWVKQRTEGRVQSLFDSQLDPDILTLLVSVVFSQGLWEKPFNHTGIRKAQFHPFHTDAYMCDIMVKEDCDMLVMESNQLKAVQLPYREGQFHAIAILPNDEGAEAMDAVVNSLSNESWSQLHASKHQADVRLLLPRFKVEFSSGLEEELQATGLKAAFSAQGEFQRMTEDPTVHVSNVYQKNTIEVTEDGTIATSAASAAVSKGIRIQEPLQLCFDRPFLFFITRNDSSILFVAKVVEPIVVPRAYFEF